MTPQEMKELMLSKRQEINDKSKRTNAESLKDGVNRIRILPGWRKDDPATFWHPFGQHFIKGSDGKTKAVFNCNERTYDQPCPVCSGLSKAISETTDDNVLKLLEGAKAGSARYLVNALILNRDGVDPSKPVVLALPGSVYDQVVKSFFEMDEDTGEETFVDITSLTEGRNFTIERTGTGVQNTKYTVRVANKSTAVAGGAAVLSQLVDLDNFVKQEAESQTKRALEAIGSISGLMLAPPGKATSLATGNDFDEDEDALRQIESKPAKATAPLATASKSANVIDADELDSINDALKATGTDDMAALDDVLAGLDE